MDTTKVRKYKIKHSCMQSENSNLKIFHKKEVTLSRKKKYSLPLGRVAAQLAAAAELAALHALSY